MPLQDWMKIISVNDRVIEHPHGSSLRLPDKHKQNKPRIMETPEGYQVWRYENEVYPQDWPRCPSPASLLLNTGWTQCGRIEDPGLL